MQRLASDDPGAHPHEGLARVGCVGMLVIFDVEVSAELAGGVFHPLLSGLPARRAKPALHGVVRPTMSVGVACGIDWRPRLEHQHLHASLGELLCGHAARSAGADYDRVIDFLWTHYRS